MSVPVLLGSLVICAVGCGGTATGGPGPATGRAHDDWQGTPVSRPGAPARASRAGSAPAASGAPAPGPASAQPLADHLARCLRTWGLAPLAAEDRGREVRAFQARTQDGNLAEVVVERPGVSGLARNLAMSQSKNDPGSAATVGARGKAFGSFRERPSAADVHALKACLR
jgi:hypothetical protein